MKNVTVPVGVPPPETGVTVAVNVTELLEPAGIELGATVRAVVVMIRLVTVR